MKRRYVLGFVGIAIALSVGLWLDIANKGLFWQFAYSVTGREDAYGQVRGVVQFAGNALRPQPRTDSTTPVNFAGVNPYGVNTFLEQEPDPAKVDATLRMIADTGFTWIRQQFIWADIEINGKGDFLDGRNDIDGDGVIDIISAWDKYDRIVDLAEAYGLQIQARVEAPPPWSRAIPEGEAGAFSPPDNFQDYADFLTVMAQRYQGRIYYYQIWNEPNIYPEWGNNTVNPEEYTRLLCMAYDALKAVDPNIVVISGTLAPTQSLTGRDLNDYIYLQRMYQAGAGDCFDVLSMQGYGLRSGPTDRRMRPTLVNISRNQYIRELMIANGDSHKAIWISEAAWNFVPSREDAPDIAEPRDMYGQVSMEQAARYIVELYQRSEREWPYVGVMNYWFFTRRSDDERNQPFYYFRMVEPYFDPAADEPFQPLPVHTALKNYIAQHIPTLYAGAHQATSHLAPHWALNVPDDAQIIPTNTATFGVALQSSSVAFRVHGTDVMLQWRDSPILQVNGQAVHGIQVGAWYSAQVNLSSGATHHDITLTTPDGNPFTLESIIVMDNTWRNRYPYILLAVLTAGMLALAVWDGLHGRRGEA
jgi:hypothetical protein